MVLPLIPLAIGAASLLSGALGLKKGFDAKKTLEEAREIGENAQRRYKNRVKELDEKRESVNQELENLGEYKKKIFKQTLGYVVQQVKNARSSVEGVNEQISSIDVREVEILDNELTRVSALDVSSGTAQGVAAGAAGAFGAYGTVGLIASASTGTAISSLSGAAATNATLAWLGGGSLASGGLGVAGGTWVLGGLVAGPALAIAGYALASKAEEALTKAEEYKAEVDVAIADLKAPHVLLDAIQSNIDDTRYVINKLVQQFAGVRLDFERHLLRVKGWRRLYAKLRGSEYQKKINQQTEEKLGKLIYFGKTIKAVISEPLLDSTGSATYGFNTRIAGIVKIESIDTQKKCCVNCGKEISFLVRTCPECNELQVLEDQEVKSNQSATNRKFVLIGFSVTLALIFLTGYWYFWVANPQNVQPEAIVASPVAAQAVSVQPEPTVDSQTTVQSVIPLIDTILQTKTLGMTSQYFETLAGPAKYIEAENSERVYEIEGCEVRTMLSTTQQSIQALNVKLSPTCNAKLGDFISNETKGVSLLQLTFGKLEELLASPMYYSANCLDSCGNAYDPSVFSSWTGPRSNNFLKVRAEVIKVGNDSIESARKWADAMIEKEGEEWVRENKFNCTPEKYSHIARELFSNIRPTSITFGYAVNKTGCPN